MIFEVGYHVGDGITSVNLIEGDEISVEAKAMEHAKKFGYELGYILPISRATADSYRAKGMPYEKA